MTAGSAFLTIHYQNREHMTDYRFGVKEDLGLPIPVETRFSVALIPHSVL
jgi:hypothetical protein